MRVFLELPAPENSQPALGSSSAQLPVMKETCYPAVSSMIGPWPRVATEHLTGQWLVQLRNSVSHFT